MTAKNNDAAWVNGEFMPLSEGKAPLEERSLLFGEGVYEVIAAYDGVPILMEEHLARLDRSSEGIRLSPPHTYEQRAKVIRELLRRVDSPRATLYGQVTRGASRRNHVFPRDTPSFEFWFARALPEYDSAMFSEGVACVTHPDERWKLCWIKSVSLLANVLAKQYAADHGCFESILIRDDNTVTEASVANFHVIKDGAIITRPEDGTILGGCKRRMILDLARADGIEVREEVYDKPFLEKIDEAFLTSTTINALPVTKIDNRPVGNGAVGPVLSRIMSLVNGDIERRVAAGRAG